MNQMREIGQTELGTWEEEQESQRGEITRARMRKEGQKSKSVEKNEKLDKYKFGGSRIKEMEYKCGKEGETEINGVEEKISEGNR